MKKILLTLIFALSFTLSEASPPSRSFTYIANTTIRSNEVSSNEDSIFSYLQSGVDTYANGSILNVAVANNAAIAETKLNLSTISQNVTFTGTTTFSNNITFAGQTIADLGTVTTMDLNGGTIDGTVIGGTTAAAGTFTTLTATGNADFQGDLRSDGILLDEQASDLSTAADQGALYTKDVSSNTELFYRDESDGTVIQLTNAGEINAVGGLEAFSVFNSATQTFTSSSYAEVSFNTENVDSGGNFASSNYTVPAAGMYMFTFSGQFNSTATGTNVEMHVALFVGGVEEVVIGGVTDYSTVSGSETIVSGSAVVNLSASDVVDVRIKMPNITGGSARLDAGNDDNQFSGFRVN